MPRLARVAIPGLPHHITQRGNRRQQTFFSDEDYAARVRPLRANNLHHLERAIRLRDRAFVYDPGEGREWQLFPQVE